MENEKKPQEIEEINLDEIEVYESKGIDLSEFEGKRAKIDKAELVTIPTWYDEVGNEMPRTGSPRMTKVIRVTTEVITEIENEEGKKIQIKASELFNIKYEDGKIKISDSPKSKFQKFFKKIKVNNLKDAIGKEVTVRSYEAKNQQVFLGFVL